MNYFLLIIINVFILFLIGLRPFFFIFNAKGDFGIGGLFFVFLSWIIWIPAAFIGFILYKFFEKLFRLRKLGTFCIIISIAINLLSIFSIFPGLGLLIQIKNIIAIQLFNVNFSLENESVNNGVYKYTLVMDNRTNKNFYSTEIRVQPVIMNPKSYLKYDPLIDVRENIYRPIDISPGVSKINGTVTLFNYEPNEASPANSPVKIEISYLNKSIF